MRYYSCEALPTANRMKGEATCEKEEDILPLFVLDFIDLFYLLYRI